MSDAPAYLPLSVPVIGESGNEHRYVMDCLDSGWVSTAGEYVTRFEGEMRRVTGARFAVACQSGTAALHIALLLRGIGPGDAVVVPTLTFIATCNAVTYTGARPVFLGCDDHMNLDPEMLRAYLAEECERGADGVLVDRTTRLRVRAVMPVHVFGNPCDMVAIMGIAGAFGLTVIEDAAESLGSRWSAGELAGRHTGTIGTMGAFSFNGNKIVTCGGGGMLVTDDEKLAARARHLTTTAKTDAVRFVHDEVGYNYRLTNLQAALGLAQLERLDSFIATKRANHSRYAAALAGIPGIELLGIPQGTQPNYWFYSLAVDPDVAALDREQLLAALEERGIQTRPVWLLNHRQRPYEGDRAYGCDRAVWFFDRVLNLPCSSDITADDVARVAAAVRDVCVEGAS